VSSGTCRKQGVIRIQFAVHDTEDIAAVENEGGNHARDIGPSITRYFPNLNILRDLLFIAVFKRVGAALST
jgi:hypothetical protein